AGGPGHHPGVVPHEPSAAAVQDGRAADPARPVFHLAARGKLLDRVVVSPDSPAHHAAGVASDMTGQTVPQRVESPRAGVSSWVVLTGHLASTKAQSGRWRHGPDTGREGPESPLTFALPGVRAGTRG